MKLLTAKSGMTIIGQAKGELNMKSNVGRRVAAGKGEHQKFGTVVAEEPNCKNHYGNYPIIVLWDNGVQTQTMSFWVDWIKEG